MKSKIKNYADREKEKIMNSPAYKRRVKNTIQDVDNYLLLYGDKNNRRDMTQNATRKFAHFFADVMQAENKRNYNDGNTTKGENAVPKDSVKY